LLLRAAVFRLRMLRMRVALGLGVALLGLAVPRLLVRAR
jgi:hypothetical protein